jgi:hypothetical protein
MASPKSPKHPEIKAAPVGAEQVRSVVDATRKKSADLIAAGIDRERLEGRLTEIEKHLDVKDHDPDRLHSLLTELRADLIRIENRLIDSGVLQLLHEILGTGVPPPR